jgi:hypothetical protein
MLGAALIAVSSGGALAQFTSQQMYQSMPGGLPPLMYNPQQGYAQQPQYYQPQVPAYDYRLPTQQPRYSYPDED